VHKQISLSKKIYHCIFSSFLGILIAISFMQRFGDIFSAVMEIRCRSSECCFVFENKWSSFLFIFLYFFCRYWWTRQTLLIILVILTVVLWSIHLGTSCLSVWYWTIWSVIVVPVRLVQLKHGQNVMEFACCLCSSCFKCMRIIVHYIPSASFVQSIKLVSWSLL